MQVYQELIAVMDSLPPLLVRGPDGEVVEVYGSADQEEM
jgi:hypothetical protein